MIKNKILFSILAFALITSIGGCTVNRPGTQTRIGQQVPNEQIPNNNLGLRRNDNIGLRRNNNLLGIDQRNRNNLVDMNRTTPDNMNMNSMSTRANKIAERVSKLNEINRCSVLLSGNTAIVGVDIKSNTQGKLTTDLKRKVENTVKKVDNSVNNVNVTANPDLFTRVSNMAKDIRDGRPISGFANEFQEILRRITPIR